MRTLQECKDEVAKQFGYSSWSAFVANEIHKQSITAMWDYIEKAAELYASQYKEELSRLKGQLEVAKNAAWITDSKIEPSQSEQSVKVELIGFDKHLEDLRVLAGMCHSFEHGHNVFKCATVCADLPNCPSKIVPKGQYDTRIKQIQTLWQQIESLKLEISNRTVLYDLLKEENERKGLELYNLKQTLKIEPCESGNSESVKLTEEKPEQRNTILRLNDEANHWMNQCLDKCVKLQTAEAENTRLREALTECIQYCHDDTASERFKATLNPHR
jgi:regulator of replication initiation timing